MTQDDARLGEFMRRHRRWLERAGLLDRPWLFFASSPSATLPSSLPPRTAHIYIKFSGFAGRARGLAEPDLILVNDHHIDRQTAGLRCHRLLALTPKDRKVVADRFRHRIPFLEPRLMHLSDSERDLICGAVLGDAFRGVGKMVRPSNGIALICYAILFDIPKIIVSGMSLTDDGHSNPHRKKFQRLHKEEDQASFAHLATRFPSLSTSEPELSALTGVPLFQG
ncbi:hypothetical protein RB623_20780 [Mesorhizobium sp. LHD-90]|uniref:hypothetical protein n=1 Tax=Mesorhizobium sp. LHD-90 TaxID=3071414 RepID=UPI0027E17CF7|nr:hypothetical protein [Mesorhizobium sp. LHD-90]MDQ6436492.1 hypothetical protein [Mesorhizobium sp. LHD-90]